MGEKIKASRYNHFVETEGGKRLAFNAMTCGLAEMDEANYRQYCELVERGEVNGEAGSDLVTELKKGGFIIPADLDELDAIRAAHYQARFGSRGFGLTLIPSLQCNCACTYCYENPMHRRKAYDSGQVMTEQVIDDVVKLCEKRLQPESALSLAWYGGEPLLATDVISRVSERLISLCHEKRCRFGAGMITNGYLLCGSTLSAICECRISFVQVTLDGPRDIHNARRPLSDGSPTYDRILANVRRLVDARDTTVSLRINVDLGNVHHLPELLDDLRAGGIGFQENMTLHFAQRMQYANSCTDLESLCMHGAAFANLAVSAYRYALGRGLRVALGPSPQLGTCGAVGASTLIVEPDGRLQCCWNAIGEAGLSIGRLTARGPEYSPEYLRWLGWEALRPECRRCDLLPVCMGGCPFRTLHPDRIHDVSRNVCCSWRYNLEEMLPTIKEGKDCGLLTVPT